MVPGATALTRMPWSAWSRAIARTRPRAAALAAAYAATEVCVAMPWTDETTTIEPPPSSAIIGAAACAARYAPLRLTSCTTSQVAWLVVTTVPCRSMPAE